MPLARSSSARPRATAPGTLALLTLLTLLTSATLGACGPSAARAPTPSMEFALTDEPFAAPIPSEHLRRADGSIDLSAYRRSRPLIVSQIHQALGSIAGFGTTSAIHLRLEEPIAPMLPSGVLDGSFELVQLVVVDPLAGEHRGERAPIRLFFQEDSGPFGSTNVLTALPVQGMPLRPDTLYALVVRRGLRTAEGVSFGRAEALDRIARGRAPEGLDEQAFLAYRVAYEALPELGIEPTSVIGMSVFRTHDPTRGMRAAAQSADRPIVPDAPFEALEVFDDYCVFRATAEVPVYQSGTPPYLDTGGEWRWSADGQLQLDHEEEAAIFVTLPREPMPAAGFPLSVLVRTGAGGDRPLVDRGPHVTAHGAAVAPGMGPGRDFARVGWAGLQIDGPHGGLRNVSGNDEQFLVFNIQNPTALRDNLRQSALELVLLARTLDRFRIDASACPGLEASEVRFDTSRVVLMGHSMGASIAPLAAAFEPTYRGLILSGAGASWIENILHKESPLATRPLAESLLGYTRIGLTLTAADPVLNLLQWAGEEADAAVYAPLLERDAAPGEARHVLMFQGIVDTYIPPRVANSLTLALGIDLAGEGLEHTDPRLAGVEPIATLLPLRERSIVPYPAHANLEFPLQSVTAIVAQHLEDGIEDGHEVMWQSEAPRAQIRCFLASFDDDAPTVASLSAAPTECPGGDRP